MVIHVHNYTHFRELGAIVYVGHLVGSAAVPRATRRLQALMLGGWSMFGSRMDTYGRRLVVVAIADGRDAGRVLIDEGLAQSSPNLGESLVLTPSILAIADPTRMRTTLRRRRQDSARPRSRRNGTGQRVSAVPVRRHAAAEAGRIEECLFLGGDDADRQVAVEDLLHRVR